LRPAVGVAADGAGRRPDGPESGRPPASVWTLASEWAPGTLSDFRMRARGRVIGFVTVVGGTAGRLDPTMRQLGQALADAAANAVLAQRERHQSELLTGQLQYALTSRVVIEQAVGILAERWQVDVKHAFQLLREYVRSHNLRLQDVAEAVVKRDLDPFPAHPKGQPSQSRQQV
jgi:hypothetical protein